MNFVQKTAQVFQMDESVWQRHTNPWSVWTRYSSLPLLVLAIWSRLWWGWWAVLPTTLVIFWIWINPRVFPKPTNTHNWASKAVLGERVWLNQKEVPIPAHHHPVIAFTNIVNALGFCVCCWGIITFKMWGTGLGISWVILGKTWFLDRMVWLFEEMKDRPQYRDWLY